MTANLQVELIKPNIGAIVQVRRSDLADQSVVNRCLDLLEEHSVLVFPRVGLSDEEQLAFTSMLGTPLRYVGAVSQGFTEKGDAYKVSLDPKVNNLREYVQATFFWHMDGFTAAHPPPKATLLSARSLAPKGGQTEFASTYAAYEHLPEAEKVDINDLHVVHSLMAGLRHVADEPTEEELARWAKQPTQEHPIVWSHDSGRKSLVIGTQADKVVGMPVPDGRALLVRLMEWAAQPDFTYRHEWEEGDLVVWDNTGILHRVIPYDGNSGRTMHRTSIAGTELVH